MEKYSVLMSVYHKERPEYLFQSVESMFGQTVSTDDFVLVCDGPLTEELDAVISRLKQKYGEKINVARFCENRGLGPALNDGLKLCKNRLVARMDSDDIAPENRCELQLNAFKENPNLIVAGGSIEEFEGGTHNILSRKEMPQTHEDILAYARKRCPFNHPTVMYDKDFVLKVGGYPNIPLHEDYGLWANLLGSGLEAFNLKETLCYMRVDGGLYGRRGGFKYLKTAVKFRWHLYKTGFSGLFQMLYVSCALIIVCLVPTWFRKFFYINFLRKKR